MLANNGPLSAAYDLGLFCLHMLHKPEKTLVLYELTHCVRETPKRAFLQTVNTHVKCRIVRHFIRVYTEC